MKEISLQIVNEEIVFVDLTNRENMELVIVCRSKNIFLFDCSTKELRLLGNLEFPLEYSEDLFKYSELIGSKREFLQMQSFKDYICVVQKYGQNGVVFNFENPNFRKQLKRGDYCVEHCSFPIAFYSMQYFTYLIHGTDWNRLDITCLESDQLLTERVIDYETDSNYFDYFHSSLSLSPDAKHFTSNGWIWHPFGQITVYSIDDFLKTFELSHKDIELTDEPYNSDWDRPLCWIDKKTLAVGFSKNAEDYGKSNFPNEILFVDIFDNKIINRIEFDGFANTGEGDVFGELFYDKEKSQFISLNNKTGLFISDINGKEIFKEKSFISHRYSAKHKLFYRINNISQSIEMIAL